MKMCHLYQLRPGQWFFVWLSGLQLQHRTREMADEHSVLTDSLDFDNLFIGA
jgi:hypothetical protein